MHVIVLRYISELLMNIVMNVLTAMNVMEQCTPKIVPIVVNANFVLHVLGVRIVLVVSTWQGNNTVFLMKNSKNLCTKNA